MKNLFSVDLNVAKKQRKAFKEFTSMFGFEPFMKKEYTSIVNNGTVSDIIEFLTQQCGEDLNEMQNIAKQCILNYDDII